MANEQLLQIINRLAEELNSSECRRVVYLCGSLDSVAVPDAREMLRTRLSQDGVDNLYLVELMFRLRRFDLLRKVFSINKEDVERILGHQKVVPDYRSLMDDLSEDMGTEDLKAAQFLLNNTLSRDKVDKIKNFLDVVEELEKLDKVSSDSVDMIEQCLRNIGRVDLAKKVNHYQRSVKVSHKPSIVSSQTVEQKRSMAACYSIASDPPVALPSRQGLFQHQRIPQKAGVAVPQTRRPYSQSPLEEYRLRTDGQGVCVIIDCVGSDGGMLEQSFSQLNFKVILHKWLSVQDTFSVLTGVSKQMETQEIDVMAFCIISRGTATDLLATDSNSVGLRLDTLEHLFTSDHCPRLAGKPKLFFIQSYRVPETQSYSRTTHRDEDLETDGVSSISQQEESVPAGADVFWSHCWTEERQLEEPDHKSLYLHTLCQNLLRGQRRSINLVDVHTEVNGAIYDHNKRSPGAAYNFNLRHTLRKNLYLP